MSISHLSDSAILDVQGAEAEAFLQSQLTCDVAQAKPGVAWHCGWCSAKGRLLATLRLMRVPCPASLGQRFWLEFDTSLAENFAKRLRMYVLRRRCRIELLDTSNAWRVFGLREPLATGLLDTLRTQTQLNPDATPDSASATGLLAQLSEPAEAKLPAAYLAVLPQHLVESLPALQTDTALEAWRLAEIQTGVPRLSAATTEQFVPQMLNLELLHGVSFQKGCYPGQEVVARSQYRGTLKRRLFLARSEAPLQVAAELFSSSDETQPCGEVVNASSLPIADSAGPGSSAGSTTYLALVSLKLEHEHAQIHTQAKDGQPSSNVPISVHISRPPYPIPNPS